MNLNIEEEKEVDLTGYTKLCKVDSLKESQGQKIVVGEVDVAVYKFENNIYALNNICPHQHSSIIHDGIIEDGCILCPAHGWEFQLKDGKMKSGRKGLDSYEVLAKDGWVYAKVYEKKFNW